MTYPETLAYLYAQLPMFQRVGAAAHKADLSNTHALMDLFGPSGTGTTACACRQHQRKRKYLPPLGECSARGRIQGRVAHPPHLKDFRERCRVNGETITEGDVVRFVEEYCAGFDPVQASFFEWTVALAFWWFREEQVDIAIVETGMEVAWTAPLWSP
ncbi:MAG: hypothetical protein IPP83_16130 [Flavobacteriales bacterium]|nr:hypothetical protein [Flavobacteriales bacterium]